MKSVVTGGSGFLGSHVADALSESGHDVTIFDRVVSPYLRKDQKMVVGDVSNQEEVRDVINGNDVVFHFAGIADIHEAIDNPVDTVKYNILGTTFLLDACREFGVKRFVYASTIYVYSDRGSFYRSTKQASELLIENYKKIYDLDFTILRFGSLYGRRANQFNFIYSIICQALLEGKIQRKSDGEEIRDYINVRDAAKACVDILDKEYENQYIMLTGIQTIKIKDLLKMIKEIFNNEIEIEYLDQRIEEHYEITPYTFRPRVARKYIPKDQYDLGQGILDCIYDVYKEINNSSETDKIKIRL
ncbi:NAD(P)-dependent oxidoreductase [candidate division KSB1 bacterium]|nr:NAD(P)-dependent oxidoreductase [candidate division KSB1 bacterium]